MKKIIFLLVVISIKLCGKPIGLANCGNTCFQNGFIQMVYQIDPLIDILSKQHDLFVQNTLGYTFQHLVWDIIDAQKTNKFALDCGSAHNPTNLKKLTEGIYSCVNLSVGRQGDLSNAFKAFIQELEKTPLEELILTVAVEGIYPDEPFTVVRPKFIPLFTMNDVAGPKSVENYIKNIFVSGQNPKKVEYDKYKLLSTPQFLLFRYSRPDIASNYKNAFFPEQLNLAEYIQENIQAIYQLRAIGVRISFGAQSGHYFAVVRDRDEKLYKCNDSTVQHVNSWQEGIGVYVPTVFLYVLKKEKDVPTVSDSTVLVDKLNKLQQGLKNIEIALKNHQFS